MPDIQLDDTLRRVFRDEATSLPFSLTTEMLERRLAGRRRLTRTSHRRLVAAAVAAVAVTGGAAFLLLGPGRMPSIGASPSPTTTAGPTIALPDASTLLVDVPTATVRLEGSVGPAVPVAEQSASGGASQVPVDAGRVTIAGPFVIATACLGPGELSVNLADTSGTAVVQYLGPCDGKVRLSEYLTDPALSGPDGFPVTVSADPASSWRLAIGTYPEDLAVAPVLPTLVPTDGWRQLADTGVSLVSPTSRTGLRGEVPGAATRLGVLVACQGEATVTFNAGTTPVDPIECGTSPSSHRFEIPAVGGEQISVRATADGFVWIRLVGETEGVADAPAARPSGPPLPSDVASAPYAATSSTLLGIGTVGGSTQRLLAIEGARPGTATGDSIPVVVTDAATGTSRLDLLSLPDGAVTATVATAEAPAMILASWADTEHQTVFYATTPDQQGDAVTYHQVAFDGSGDREIAKSSVGAGRYLFGAADADLSRDGREFVMDTCADLICSFVILDIETGDIRTVSRGADTFCSILGITGDTVVSMAMDACTPFDPGFSLDGASRILALPLDGSAGRTLIDGVGSGQVVETPTGPRFVFTRTGATGATTVESVDIAGGELVSVAKLAAGDPFVGPVPVRLPAGWVLLASLSLGDFPQTVIGPRAVPLLIDLVSGDSYDLINLPH